MSRIAQWWYNMGMNEEKIELGRILAENITYYRKKLNLTQLELAEKLNYSDKSVSKWERAEGIPDVFVLKELSGFFGVSMDTLLSKRKKPFSLFRNKYLLAYFYAFIFVVIGIRTYGVLNLLHVDYDNWKIIIYSLIFSSLTLLIFYLVWQRLIEIYIYLTLFVWLLSLSTTLIMMQPDNHWVYIITSPIYALLVFLIYIL